MGTRSHVVRAALAASWVAGAGFTLLAPVEAEAQTGGARVVLNTVWRVKVYSRPDHMSTNRADERDGWPNDGQVWYLPKTQIGGTVPVYRLYSPNWGGHMDHMDSLTPGEAGFQTEWDRTLGHAFTSSTAAPGLTRLNRTYNSSNFDHGSRSAYEGMPAGYTDEPLNAYGWSRYNHQHTNFITSSGGGVTIRSNRVAGGALWHWEHNSFQYINNFDYGRQIQAALFFNDGAPRNPTEGGDAMTYASLPTANRHGAPMVSENNWGSGHSTRAIPLEWDVWPLGGGWENPVLWKDMVLGKNIQLNYNNLGAVAHYTTVVTVPQSMYVDLLHMPVAFLKPELNRFYTYDATKAAGSRLTAQDANVPDCSGNGYYTPHVAYGGGIVANATGTRALGIYSVNRANGGSATHIAFHDIRGPNSPCRNDNGEFAADVTAVQAAFVGTLPAGTSYYQAWIITGTLTEVQNHMQSLYNLGVK